MLNPLNTPIVVPFEGKTYNCDLTLAAIPGVEGELNIGILCPTEQSVWAKPEFYARAVILYLLLRSRPIPNLTLARCQAAVVGDDAERVGACCAEAVLRLQPHIKRLNGIVEAEDARPTDAQSTGPGSGQSGSSHSESQSPNSGA